MLRVQRYFVDAIYCKIKKANKQTTTTAKTFLQFRQNSEKFHVTVGLFVENCQMSYCVIIFYDLLGVNLFNSNIFITCR